MNHASEMQNFEEDVLSLSHSIPVLVDFWAPWCGPCRILGPVLDRVAESAAGKWKLVKLNTDEHPDISARYGIKGIPAVKLFVDGEVIDEFTGALPEPAVRRWLEKALPSKDKAQLELAADELANGNTAAATTILEDILADDPSNAAACGMLARTVVWQDPVRAVDLAKRAENEDAEWIRQSQSISTIATAMKTDESELPEGIGKASFAKALASLNEGNTDQAIAALVNVIVVDRYYNDDAARELCVALFDVLGPEHPDTKQHRRTFDMSLY